MEGPWGLVGVLFGGLRLSDQGLVSVFLRSEGPCEGQNFSASLPQF